jgi:uncharacterized protein (UPF0332 family)
MTSKFNTKDVAKASYSHYLKKAQECFHAAQHSFNGEEWNASAINAIHCCISACDAICVYFLGKRHSGEDHNDAAKLFQSIKNDDEAKRNTNRIIKILRIKNMAEYEERLVRKAEAEAILKDCERLFDYVKKQIGRE